MLNKTKYLEALAELEKKMDAREALYLMIDKMVLKTGEVPDRYKKDWEVWTGHERRIPWRMQPLVVMKIRTAARMMARRK